MQICIPCSGSGWQGVPRSLVYNMDERNCFRYHFFGSSFNGSFIFPMTLYCHQRWLKERTALGRDMPPFFITRTVKAFSDQ